MKLYEALSAALVAEGIDMAFGLVAGGIDEVIRDLADVKRIRYVKVRHEEVAVGMADGYSRASGKVGLAVIDGGPGLANACAPLLAARMSGSKLLVIMSGGEGEDRHTYDVTNRQNNMSFDQAPLIEASAGTWQAIRSPATLSDDVAQAFRHIRLGRGPIVLTIEGQQQIMADDWRYAPTVPTRPEGPSGAPRPGDVQALAWRIADSRRPLILAGRGAWYSGAGAALTALADRSGALVANTLLGRGLFNADPYGLGVSGGFAIEDARPILKQADLVVAFGAQLNSFTMDHGNLYRDAHLVQVDINPAAIGEYHPVDQAIVADAKLTAQALSLSLDKIDRPDWRGPDMAARIKTFDRWHGRDMAERPGRANIRRVVDAIDRLAPKDRMACIDIGLFMGPPAAYMTVPAPDAQVFPWQLGRVGVGLAVAAGAALGRPDRLMIGFVGDGGMMAAMNALDTLRAEKIPMLLIVMDDGGFGADRRIFQIHGENTSVCDYETPDLVAIAKAFGLWAFKVTSGAEMERVLKGADLTQSATLVHVVTDPTVPAQEMDFAIYKSNIPH